MAKRKPKSPRAIATQTEAAKHFGVYSSTVRNWRLRGCTGIVQDPEHPSRHLHNLSAMQAWLEGRGLRAPGDPKPLVASGFPSAALLGGPAVSGEEQSVSERSSRASTRKKEAEAELAEIRLAEAKGVLVSQSEVDSRIAQAIESCRSALTAVPRKYCDHLSLAQGPIEMRQRLAEVMTELLGVFSGELSGEGE